MRHSLYNPLDFDSFDLCMSDLLTAISRCFSRIQLHPQRSRYDIVRQLNPYVAHVISHQTDLLPPETLNDVKIRHRYHLLRCIIRLTTKAETSCD